MCCFQYRGFQLIDKVVEQTPAIFPRFAPVACFPALGTGCTFSRSWHRLYLFPHLAPVLFPALGTSFTFPTARHRLYFFPRLALVVRFPTLGTGCTFCALGTGCTFSRAWHRLPNTISDWFIASLASCDLPLYS